jgi:hypothetical protein
MLSQLIDIEQAVWFDNGFDELLDSLESRPDRLVFTLIWEAIEFKHWEKNFKTLVARAKELNKSVALIMESWYKPFEQKIMECGVDEIIFVDYNLVLIYYRLIKNQECNVAQHWDPKNNTWLFLTGKPSKPNRLGFLYNLYKEKLLDRCVWSLFVSDDIEFRRCQSYLSDLDKTQARQWIAEFSRNPDQISAITTNMGFHYSGIPYGNIYESALFQVVPETNCHFGTPMLTEKIWLSILNRRPFIVFGNPGTNYALQTLGFDTYDQFLIDLKFDQKYDIKTRYQSLNDNIRHWLDILPEHSLEIAKITEHNYNTLLEYINSDVNKLEKFLKDCKLGTDITSLLPVRDQLVHAQWKNWYARIKDSHWPECEREEDFSKLPGWIQKECIEVFGYNPGVKL